MFGSNLDAVKSLNSRSRETKIGLAYGLGVPEFICTNPGLVDYLEIPFEQLRHAPHLRSIQESIPLLLHCASMSVAGSVPPSDETLEEIREEAERTRTPWIGEHLAFIAADALETASNTLGTPTALTYTVCPQLSEDAVERVLENVAKLRSRYDVPLILENSPQYFSIPGSTMSMVDFIAAVFSRCDLGLLLDLTHFLITSLNTGTDAFEQLAQLPLERVVEIHISGVNVQSGVAWDDHSIPAPSLVFKLLEHVLDRARPLALTLEYNWSPYFPETILREHIQRLRHLIGRL